MGLLYWLAGKLSADPKHVNQDNKVSREEFTYQHDGSQQCGMLLGFNPEAEPAAWNH